MAIFRINSEPPSGSFRFHRVNVASSLLPSVISRIMSVSPIGLLRSHRVNVANFLYPSVIFRINSVSPSQSTRSVQNDSAASIPEIVLPPQIAYNLVLRRFYIKINGFDETHNFCVEFFPSEAILIEFHAIISSSVNMSISELVISIASELRLKLASYPSRSS